MEKLEPKHRRPGKPGHIWPGVYKASPSQQALNPDRKKHPWMLACPAPLCFYQGAYADEAMARKMQETHPCPWYGGGPATISRGMMSDMFLAPIWKQLDEAVDNLMAYKSGALVLEEDYTEQALGQKEGKCRGLAEALAVLMPPFFSTGDEIVQEAVVRWQKRQAGEEYETPGIGKLRFAVPPGAETMTPSGMYHDSVVGTKYAPEYHPANAVKNFGLGEGKVAEILKQLDQGFTSKMLAVVHGTTENIIKQIAKAHGKTA